MDIFDKLVSGASQLPVSLQSESAECGLSCLAMISSYHGAHVTTSSLRAKYGISSAGANLKQLIGIAEGLRLSSRPLRVELSDLELLRTPCILHWQFKHFVVLKSAKGGKFVIHDPAFGVRHLSKEAVSAEFTGVAIELWPELEFEKKQKIPRVSIARVVGRLVGLTRSISRVIAVSLLIEILSLLSPLYMQWVIDYVIVNDDRDLMTTLALSFGLLVIFQQIFRWSREWMMLHLSSTFGLQWRSNVFSHLVNLSPDYFQKRHLGDVVSRFNGVDNIQRTLTSSFLVSIIDSVMALAVLAMMVVYSPMLAVISLASTLLYVIVKCAWYVPMNAANLEQVVRTAQQQSNFLETVRGIKTIRLYHKQSDRHASWLSLYARQLNSSVKLQKLSIGYQQVSSLLSGAENIIVLWCGAQMIMDGYFQ